MTTDSQGNMFVVNSQGPGVFRIHYSTGQSAQLTTLRVPQYAVAVSSAGGPVYTYKDSNLYSIDQTTLSETTMYTSPDGFGCVAVDPSGMVYFAQGTSIYKLNPSTKVATLLALSGVTLTSVQMIRADGLGNLFVLDGNSGTTILRKIVLSTGVVSSIVSTISFSMAIGLAVSDSGNIYVTDVWGNKVVMLVLHNDS
jgi:sugar lactone lactonase YvrE